MSHMGAYSRNIARAPPGRLMAITLCGRAIAVLSRLGTGWSCITHNHGSRVNNSSSVSFRSVENSVWTDMGDPSPLLGRAAVNAEDTLFWAWTQKVPYAPIKSGVLVTRAVPGPNRRSVCLFKGVGLLVQAAPDLHILEARLLLCTSHIEYSEPNLFFIIMDFSGNWNEPRPTADWDDARPQRPVNPELSFDLADDLISWNQPMHQQSDVGYPTRPLRGATQQADTSSDPLRGPIQRPIAPFTPVMTEDVNNGAWDSQEGRPPRMNEPIQQLRQRYSSLTSTVQDQGNTVRELKITVRGLTRTIQGLEADQSNMEQRFNARTQ